MAAADSVVYQTATPATPPTTQRVAVDTATEGDIQLVKLAISTDGSALFIPAEVIRGMAFFSDELRVLLEQILTELRVANIQREAALTGYSPNRTYDPGVTLAR